MMKHGTQRNSSPASLNEGRGVSPGDTAKCCRRTETAEDVALLEVWEAEKQGSGWYLTVSSGRSRPNCGYRYAESRVMEVRPGKFGRITGGSQIDQRTQGCPSSWASERPSRRRASPIPPVKRYTITESTW